jgi:hypothetical protein
MANGSASIQCSNCWHFKHSESGRNCKKHDFVFPKTGYEILCRDYRRNFIKRIFTDIQAFIAFLILGIPALLLYIFAGGWIADCKSIRKRKQLKPHVLYFSACTSQKPPQPFAPFSELQSLVSAKRVTVKISAEYGLSIHLDSTAIADIPDLGKNIEIEIDSNKLKFGVKGNFNVLYSLEIPSNVKHLTDRASALLLAQPDFEKYKIIPDYFR